MFSSSLLILVDLLSELLNTLTPVWTRIRFEIAFNGHVSSSDKHLGSESSL